MAIKKHLMGRTLKKTKINKDTFSMGGGSLADKVANNSRKITLIKNVISTGKSDLGSQLASLDGRSSSPQSDLTEINDTLNDIGNALALDFANRIAIEKGENKRLRTDASKQKNKRAEGRIEKSLKGGLTKVLAPIAKAGQKITDLAGLMALSALGNTLLADKPKNTDFFDEEGLIDPITQAGKNGALNKEETGPERLGDTFSSPDDKITVGGEETGMTADEYNRATYYVDQKGRVRLKEDNSRPWGSRFIPKEGLEKRNFPSNNGGFSQSKIPTDGSVMPSMFTPITDQDLLNEKLKKLNKANKKINVSEITLPTIKLNKQNNLQTVPSVADATSVPYVISVNSSNEHMTKTPEIHGIIVG